MANAKTVHTNSTTCNLQPATCNLQPATCNLHWTTGGAADSHREIRKIREKDCDAAPLYSGSTASIPLATSSILPTIKEWLLYEGDAAALHRLGHEMKTFIAWLVLSLNGLLIASADPPNIIYIMADDLGYAELGCYGQTKIQTPNIDRLAREGMRFTQFYSGSPVCAPSRCTVLTGLHTGHAVVRNNNRIGGWDLGLPNIDGGQYPLPAGTTTVAGVLQKRGYDTAFIGKWGLGGRGTSGEPRKHGFDRFFGYLCQRQAHTHYPEFLFDNETVLEIPENFHGQHGRHSHDMMTEQALKWIGQRTTQRTAQRTSDKPFFLYLAPAIPHVSIQATAEAIARYDGKFDEPRKYQQSKPGGYTSQSKPRTAYAAMIHMLDRDVGRLLDLLDEKGLAKNTLVIFTSDNGPTFNGGTDSAFFGSAGPFGGLKTSVLEGGIRVPFVVRWPDRVKAGTVSDHASATWDLLPTFAHAAGAPIPDQLDGLSMLAELTGEGEQAKHETLYWELAPQQALRAGDWKLVLRPRNPKATRKLVGDVHLFHLGNDPGETKDLAKDHPEQVTRLKALLKKARTPHLDFPLTPKPAKK